MREHVVLSVVDPLLAASLQPEHGGHQEKDLTLMVECRICQEDDTIQNLDIPCGCNGTLKFAHRECVQLWCYEKGDTICEICHQYGLAGYTQHIDNFLVDYIAVTLLVISDLRDWETLIDMTLMIGPFKPGYSATTTVYHPGDTSIDISDDWESSSIPLDLHNSRLLAIAAVEHQVPEIREGYANAAGTSGITLWHSVGLILMALLLLRNVAPLFNADVEKVLTYFYFFFLRTAAVVLPWYLMAWIIRVIQHQRQRQQAPEELAFMLQADEQG